MARTPKHQPQRNTVAILGDGQTERIYFSDVRDTDRPANLSIFPDYSRKIGNYKGVLIINKRYIEKIKIGQKLLVLSYWKTIPV